MKSSAYLAIKCLFTLGIEYAKMNPRIASIIKNDFYVDDMLTGFDTIEEAQQTCSEIIKVLQEGQFSLRKFYSNEPEILKEIDTESNEAKVIKFGENENAKTLGLSWSPHCDMLQYRISQISHNHSVLTKRLMLSDISQIFDPLGLLSVCTITAKIMLQRLWLERVSWEEPSRAAA